MKTLIKLVGAAILFASFDIQAQNIVAEVNPNLVTKMSWDYTLPDVNVTGFKVYKKVVASGGLVSWVLVGTVAAPNKELQLPAPVLGTYTVTAYNPNFESDKSVEILLIQMSTKPLAPNNLRVIQIP
jgi:hypothetical protein